MGRACGVLSGPPRRTAETLSFSYVLAFDMLYDAFMRFALRLVEMNLVPDFLLRRGIRFLLALRLKELKAPTGEEQQRRLVVRAAGGARQRRAWSPKRLRLH